ncbi:MAG: hypothetical protein J6T23_07475 [Elusimicrobia bacterium]|nr:hypothetical protein [Elusimicrobiota bacterium]
MKLYVILPIYNIEVDNDVINTEIISGYKLITNETFFNSYKKEIVFNENTDVYRSLYEDILIPQSGMSCTRELAKYILIKEYEVKKEYDFDNKLFHDFMYEEKGNLNTLILILRLVQKGSCQANSFYIFTIGTQARDVTDFSTNRDSIHSSLSSTDEIIYENKYIISIETIKKLNQASLIIRDFSKEKTIPVVYFMQYYNSISTYDRIIKLAIVLESSVLAGIKEELNYRLRIRASAFLKRDCQKILNVFYQLRSCIVHNGSIDTKYFKEIKKIINDEQCSDSKALFVFLSDYVEPLVRDILYKSFEIFAKDEKIKNYKDLFSSADVEIFKKITE